MFIYAFIFLCLNRLCDGLDGAMARLVGETDLGAFYDIVLDFLFYSLFPLSFILLDETERTGERMHSFLLVILIALFPSFSLSDEVTAEAQRLLNELGYNAGPVDGLIGGKTRNAMSDAFKSVGKEWDRDLDEGDLAILKDILKEIKD